MSTINTSLAIVIYKAALLKLNECRQKCPGIGGDIDASNLSWMIERRLINSKAAMQASDCLENLSKSLGVDASDEISSLKEICGHVDFDRARCLLYANINHSSDQIEQDWPE